MGKRGRRPRIMPPVEQALMAQDGEVVPGGCQDCGAYTKLSAKGDGVFELLVHHDDTCPTWAEIKGN